MDVIGRCNGLDGPCLCLCVPVSLCPAKLDRGERVSVPLFPCPLVPLSPRQAIVLSDCRCRVVGVPPALSSWGA